MVIIYMAAALIGGAITSALVWQQGLLLSILAAPLGGSLSALAAAPLVLRSSRAEAISPEVVWC